MFRRGDYVACTGMRDGPASRVIRAARDGTWVDIRASWFDMRLVDMHPELAASSRVEMWSKRMKAKHLVPAAPLDPAPSGE